MHLESSLDELLVAATAEAFKCVIQCWTDGGSYRHLLELLGMKDHYGELIAGLELTNANPQNYVVEARQGYEKVDIPLNGKEGE